MAGNQQEDEHEAALSDGDRSRASDSHEAQPGQKLQAKWDEMYGRLVAFQEREGHCLVPNRYPKDPQLGSWVSTQRRHYKILTSGNGESTPMTPERAQKLVDIGFKWSTKDPRHVPWEHRYAELVAFQEKYGHSQVPIGWEENVQLSNWVSTQRQEYKLIQRGRQSRLNQGKIDQLNKIDFVWEAQRGGPRRKRKATVAVPPKANPVDVGKLRSRGPTRGRGEMLPGSLRGAPLTMGLDIGQGTLSSFGSTPQYFQRVQGGVPVANPAQWQLLANGAYQSSATQPGSLPMQGQPQQQASFPLANQFTMGQPGLSFAVNSQIWNGAPQMVGLQQRQMMQMRQAVDSGEQGRDAGVTPSQLDAAGHDEKLP